MLDKFNISQNLADSNNTYENSFKRIKKKYELFFEKFKKKKNLSLKKILK